MNDAMRAEIREEACPVPSPAVKPPDVDLPAAKP